MNQGALANHIKAKNRYELSPKVCLYCSRQFSFEEYKKDRKKKFCNHSCTAKFHNRRRFKSLKAEKYKEFPFCLSCNKKLTIINYKYKKYCDHQCQMDYQYNQYNQYIIRWQQNLEKGYTGKTKMLVKPIRKYIFKKYNYQCAKCEENRINPYSKKSILQIDHIDGDCENNKEENLILLCPTCHSLTSTYGALNMGKSKRYYKTNGELKEKLI